MKIVIGWLSDPWVHLLGIGILVVGIGSRMGTAGTPTTDSMGLPGCETCHKQHDTSRPCYEAFTARLGTPTNR